MNRQKNERRGKVIAWIYYNGHGRWPIQTCSGLEDVYKHPDFHSNRNRNVHGLVNPSDLEAEAKEGTKP